jgi:MFS family permease
MFRSLKTYNYRLWAGGAIVSNVGTWMQRIAQDWIVLTRLTHHNATAVGIVMALQFGPQVVFLPWTGYVADHFDRRRLLIATQAAMGLLASGLGALTLAGRVQLWHVYGFALLLGCVASFDTPARQTFVSDLVPESDLPNAVALNSASFNLARLIMINGASFGAVIASLALLRRSDLHRNSLVRTPPGGLTDGFRYVWRRADLRTVYFMLLLIGTFALNFPIFISTMSVSVFHAGADEYGLLTSMLALGSVAGALWAARGHRPRGTFLFGGAAVLGLGYALAAVMPAYWLFGVTLFVIGVAAQVFTTTVTSIVQLTTEPAMRGRVIAILLAVALGGTPIGAPIEGWVSDTFGPRWALMAGAASAFAAALAGMRYLMKHRGLTVRLEHRRLKVELRD